jgi:hypothetical protein
LVLVLNNPQSELSNATAMRAAKHSDDTITAGPLNIGLSIDLVIMSQLVVIRNNLRNLNGGGLHRNCAALILDQAMRGSFGCLFWLVDAHYGPPLTICSVKRLAERSVP